LWTTIGGRILSKVFVLAFNRILKFCLLVLDINIYIPENAKSNTMHENVDTNDILQKPYYNLDKAKEWHDMGLPELLGILYIIFSLIMLQHISDFKVNSPI
jgi:hypothetical protein